MKTISNVVLTPQSKAEKIATERILISHCLKYSEIESVFEVYEDLSPKDWQELLEEIDRETADRNMTQLQHFLYELRFDKVRRIRQYMETRYGQSCHSLEDIEQAVYNYAAEDWFKELSEVLD